MELSGETPVSVSRIDFSNFLTHKIQISAENRYHRLLFFKYPTNDETGLRVSVFAQLQV